MPAADSIATYSETALQGAVRDLKRFVATGWEKGWIRERKAILEAEIAKREQQDKEAIQ